MAKTKGNKKKANQLPVEARRVDAELLPTEVAGAVATRDPLLVYLQEIRKYPLLTREQEQELAEKYFATKDPELAQQLITSNLRFVVKVAAEYSKFGARMIDLIQEGNMGLMHAVKEFNPFKGARLITYAVWWIRGYIQEYLMKQYSLVKIGTTQNQKKLFYRLQKEQEALEAMSTNEGLALLGTQMGISQEEVTEMAQRLRGRDLSLDAPIDENEERAASLISLQRDAAELPDEDLASKELKTILLQEIDSLRAELNEKEQFILNERLLADEPLTLQEIGERFGTTREAVRQMENRVLKKIKARMVPY